ncbi:MAG: hypothetical protein VXZ38_10890 [Planctomycetota bacterium]|nr:hypothetical protein [Planctomycetota bacterium]
MPTRIALQTNLPNPSIAMKSGCIAGKLIPKGLQLKLALVVVSFALVLFPKSSIAETHLKIRQLTPKVSYGSTPLTGAEFNLLKAKGFNTIISVDGVAPNLNFSEPRSLDYVHLPIRYSGVDRQRALDLSKTVDAASERIYIHCHHGKHRAPVAAIIACAGNGSLPINKITEVLLMNPSVKRYEGLMESARSAELFSKETLQDHEIDPHKQEDLSITTFWMIELRKQADLLFQIAEQPKKFKPSSAVGLANRSLAVVEAFQELIRVNATSDDLYLQPLQAGLKTAEEIHQQLLELQATSGTYDRSERWQESIDLMIKLRNHCTSCHRDHR